VVADIFCEEKYDEFVNTITKDPNHTRVFFFGEEHKKVKRMGRMITVSSKEQLEKQLRKEITGLLFGEADITYKGT
jgi:UDP-N-acetylmuramyl pentapeptide synthase